MHSLFIIDDHPLVTDGVATMLKSETEIRIIGTAKTGNEAIVFLNHTVPDIILLDINLPDVDGLELCVKIKKLTPSSKIIFLTSIVDQAIVVQAFANGAYGYLLKDMERRELLTAIDMVLDGKIYLGNVTNLKLLEHWQESKSILPSSIVLTRREKEVLELLEKGLNGPQIADKLCISPYTVETHRKNLMQKFNTNTTQLLLKTARELSFLD